MEVIGGGSVVVRSAADEGPHLASSHEWWQESVTLIWWELDNYARDVDIATYIEPDGFTHRGGRVRVTLADGEVMNLECEILQKGTVNSHHGNTGLDTFCRMTCGDKTGVCDFEIANRPFQVTTPPVRLEKAIAENGLFEASV